ncbi:MAG: NUDIX domain-containing protein [Candidatus Jordarchaeaceae archaeon]
MEIIACVRKTDVGCEVFPMEREEAHKKNVKHIVVRVLGFNRDGMVLVQRRSLSKKSHPGMYTDSASGHVLYEAGFSFESIVKSAERELWEEMGVKGFLKPYIRKKFDEEDLELNYVFLALIEGQPKFNEEEVDVEKSGFKTVKQLRLMLEKERFVKFARELWEQFLIDYPTAEAIQLLADTIEKETIKKKTKVKNRD